jgi:hypothetical protein
MKIAEIDRSTCPNCWKDGAHVCYGAIIRGSTARLYNQTMDLCSCSKAKCRAEQKRKRAKLEKLEDKEQVQSQEGRS